MTALAPLVVKDVLPFYYTITHFSKQTKRNERRPQIMASLTRIVKNSVQLIKGIQTHRTFSCECDFRKRKCMFFSIYLIIVREHFL